MNLLSSKKLWMIWLGLLLAQPVLAQNYDLLDSSIALGKHSYEILDPEIEVYDEHVYQSFLQGLSAASRAKFSEYSVEEISEASVVRYWLKHDREKKQGHNPTFQHMVNCDLTKDAVEVFQNEVLLGSFQVFRRETMDRCPEETILIDAIENFKTIDLGSDYCLHDSLWQDFLLRKNPTWKNVSPKTTYLYTKDY
ncbi:MAG: hypothetical protein KDD52_03220 [Bdellovibrionales bacterium]|nr:hypothetical protein [Bdellovibrionales bacterium]